MEVSSFHWGHSWSGRLVLAGFVIRIMLLVDSSGLICLIGGWSIGIIFLMAWHNSSLGLWFLESVFLASVFLMIVAGSYFLGLEDLVTLLFFLLFFSHLVVGCSHYGSIIRGLLVVGAFIEARLLGVWGHDLCLPHV